MRLDLQGRRALITGAGRGLGLEIARGLAQAGASVWVNGRNAETVEEATQTLLSEHLNAHQACFDITDPDAREAWFRDSPHPDILINNATLRDRRATPELPVEAVSKLLDVNTLAAYALTRLALPGMQKVGRGAIVNMCSIAGPRAGPADPGYTLAKGALEAMTRAQAVELGGQGIRVNGIAPGFFATEANERMVGDPDIEAYLAARVPMARWAEPQGSRWSSCLSVLGPSIIHQRPCTGRRWRNERENVENTPGGKTGGALSFRE